MKVKVVSVTLLDYEKGLYSVKLDNGGTLAVVNKDDLVKQLNKCRERDSDGAGLMALVGTTLEI